MNQFDHERLDVYQTAIEFVALADEVVERLPRGRAYLADQLQRAATSIPLNIAEGAGEFAPKEKGRFYRMAKRSATESAAVLDVCRRLKLIENSQFVSGTRAPVAPRRDADSDGSPGGRIGHGLGHGLGHDQTRSA